MKYTNNFNLPASIYDALTIDSKPSSHKKDDMVVAVTTLIRPYRISILTNRHYHELEEDISDGIWRIFGSAVHFFLEQAKHADRLIEKKLDLTIDGVKILGRYDLFETKEKLLFDYKVTSVWSVIFDSDNTDYENQMNVYAYLSRKKGIPVEGLRAIQILRDWRSGEARKDPGYPQIPIVVKPIPLWPEAKAKSYLEERVTGWKKNLTLKDDELPLCTSEERWATKNTYAVYKGENKRAMKVLTDMQEAEAFVEAMTNQYPDFKLTIQTREGKDKRCTDYCSVNKFCSYYQAQLKEVEANGIQG